MTDSARYSDCGSRQAFLLYREEILAASETFILAQAESLPRFEPFYVGLRRRPGLDAPESRLHIESGPGLAGKFQRARFKLAGPSARLRSMLAAKSPALIHAHFGTDACNAMALAEALELPLVVTFHGYDVTVDDALLPRLFIRRRDKLKARAARFLCVSEFIRSRAIAKGFPADKTIVHYTGIDCETFRSSPDISRSPIVLFAGRLMPKKGCEYLIRAMARVQAVEPAIQLVVLGDGPLRSELERQAARQLKNYQFIGEQKPVVVRDWMNRAMVFSTPSIVADSGDAEGFGMVFAEAQAMGLPVVSFRSGGIPEAVTDGETGFLVPERNEEALAARLLHLFGDVHLWNSMSHAGRLRARRLFDIRTQAARLENIYDDVISEWEIQGRAPKFFGEIRGAPLNRRNSMVSAVIPTRGRPELVARAVRSALAQSYEDLEVIVVLDGPDPATEKTLAQFADKRLRVIPLAEAVGAAQARNIGVNAARGDWIAFLDDDDEWLPEKTLLQMERAMSSVHRYPIVSSQCYAQTSRCRLIWPRLEPYEPLSEYLLARNSWSYGEGLLLTTTLLAPKDLLLDVPFRPGLRRHQDFDWILRATEREETGIEFVSKPLAIWHHAEHRSSISTSTDWRTSLEWIESVRSITTDRAYAGFLATQIAPQAARAGDWSAFPSLLKRMIARGKPNSRDLLLFFGMWSVPYGLRRMIRKAER